MVKFNCIIHKETGTVIKYEDWLKSLNTNERIISINSNSKTTKLSVYHYTTKEMLFSDDFEIIYDSEFTLQELANIFSKDISKELESKILNESMKKAVLKDKYGIEV